MYPHGAELGTFGLERLGAHSGQETDEVPSVPAVAFCLPCSEGEPEEGEGGVFVLSPAFPVLAIDDPRFDALMFVKSRE